MRKSLVNLALGTGAVAMMLSAVSMPTAAAATNNNSVTLFEPGNSWADLSDQEWSSAALQIAFGTMYEGLYGYDMNNKVVPKIAESITHDKTYTVWTIHLRHDAKWSNGKPVTAHDFYFAWMWLIRPGQKSFPPIWNSPMESVNNSWQYLAGQVKQNQVGLKVLNNWTLQATLYNSTPGWGNTLADQAGAPLYAPVVKAHPTNWWEPKYFVGDGPYLPKSFTPNGKVVLVRNPNYVGHPGEYNVGNVQTINVIPAPTTPVESYLAHTTDVAMISQGSDFTYANRNRVLKSQLHADPVWSVTDLSWDDSQQSGPLDNPLVRQAISLAINRNIIANNVKQGMVKPITTMLPPGLDKYATVHAQTNIAKAQALLKKAGYPGGQGVTVTLYQSAGPADTTLESIQAQLVQALGIKVNIVELPPSQFAYLSSYAPTNILPGYFISGTGANNGNYQGVYSVGGTSVERMSPEVRQHAESAYFAIFTEGKYDPAAIAKYGDPSNPQSGVNWLDWQKLHASFLYDLHYMTTDRDYLKYIAYEPAQHPTMQDLWNTAVSDWKSAKTDADKHAAWLKAFAVVAGAPSQTTNMDMTVYIYKHYTQQNFELDYLNSQLFNGPTSAYQKIGGTLSDATVKSGWVIPLYVGTNVYLKQPWITDVITNPWTFNGFYNLQYMNVKSH